MARYCMRSVRFKSEHWDRGARPSPCGNVRHTNIILVVFNRGMDVESETSYGDEVLIVETEGGQKIPLEHVRSTFARIWRHYVGAFPRKVSTRERDMDLRPRICGFGYPSRPCLIEARQCS